MFDLPALREVLGQLRSRAIRVVSVDTPKASPFAQSLLFNWIAAYMYEGDAPLAERRAAALALDRDLLRDLLGAEELRELLDPGVLADLELELQCLTDGRRARDADELHDVLRKVGDLTAAEIDLRCEGGDGRAWIDELVRRAAGRSSSASASEVRFIAAEDAARYRDALGCRCRSACRGRSPSRCRMPLESLVARYARTHAPVRHRRRRPAFGVPVTRIAGALPRSRPTSGWCAASSAPMASQREWCDVDVLRQLRRRSLARCAARSSPSSPTPSPASSPQWHGIPAERRGLEALVEALGLLQGAALVASSLETDVLPSRVRGYRAVRPRRVVHRGRDRLDRRRFDRRHDGRVRLFFADQLALLAPSVEPIEPPDRCRCTTRCAPCSPSAGASFWAQLRAGRRRGRPRPRLLAALWDLVWAGEVTNDSLAPLRAVLAGARDHGRSRRRTAPRGRPRPGRLTRIGPPAGAGRWSLVAPLLCPCRRPPRRRTRRRCNARALRRRHPRGGAGRGRRRRLRRRVRRAQGARRARAGPPRLLRRRVSAPRSSACPVPSIGCAACARRPTPSSIRRRCPPRSSSPPPTRRSPTARRCRGRRRPGRPARSAGALVVLWQGEPLVWFDRRSHHLVTFPDTLDDWGGPAWAEALAGLVKDGRARSMRGAQGRRRAARRGSRRCADAVAPRGFVDSYRGLVFRAS